MRNTPSHLSPITFHLSPVTLRALLVSLSPFLLLFLLAACGAPSPTPTPMPPPAAVAPAGEATVRIVAMGDSLTEGMGVPMDEAYPAQLERKLQAAGYDVSVVNAGISGETSSGTLTRVD